MAKGVKLSIYSTFDDKGQKQADRAMTAFTKKFGVLSGEGKNANLVLGDTTRRLAEASIKFEQAGARMQAVGSNLSSLGGSLTKGLTLPILAIGGAALKASTDFESAFAEVNKSVDATSAQLADLRDDILETSKRMPVSADAIANVYAMGGQLGIATESLGAFSETVMGLDIATNMTLEDGASQVAKFSNIMGTMAREGTDGFEKLGSTLVALGNNGASTEADIMAMAMRIAGAGSQIGLSEANVLALSNALSSMGIEAESGGSAISKTMSEIDATVAKASLSPKEYAKVLGSSLDKASGELKKNSKSLTTWAETAGMSAEDFAKAWKADPVKALEAVFRGMGDVKDEGGNLNVLLEELGITELRQTDMLKRVSGAADLLSSSVQVANDEWGTNSALTDEVAKRNETAAAKFQMLKNEVTAAAIEMGDKLAPAALDVAGKISDLVKKFSALSPAQMESILKWGLIIAAIGPVVLVIGKLVTVVGMVTSALGSLAAVGAGVGAAFMNGGMASGFGAIATALGLGPGGLALAAGAVVIALATMGTALDNTAQKSSIAKQAADQLAAAQGGLENSYRRAEAALLASQGATLGAEQATINLKNADDALATAQATLNQLQGSGKASNEQLAEAQRGVEQATINQSQAWLDATAAAQGQWAANAEVAASNAAIATQEGNVVAAEAGKQFALAVTSDAYRTYMGLIQTKITMDPNIGADAAVAEIKRLEQAWLKAYYAQQNYAGATGGSRYYGPGSGTGQTLMADGGFSHGPETITWGEAGPEVIIPLDGSKNAMSLFAETARRLGVSMSPASMKVAAPVRSGNSTTTVNNHYYQIGDVSIPADDPAAQQVFGDLASLVRRYSRMQPTGA